MPQPRPRSKTSNRQGNESNQRKNAAGQTAGPRNGGETASTQPGRKASGRQDTQGARSQRANNQRNQNDLPAHQRGRNTRRPVRGREFVESYESGSDQPQSNRAFEFARGQRDQSGVGRNEGRGSSRSGYNYQEEDFEEGGQGDSNVRGGGQGQRGRGQQQGGRGQYGQGQHDRDQRSYQGGGQYDRDSGYAHGGYGPPPNLREGRGNGGQHGGYRGPSQYEPEGEWAQPPQNNPRGRSQGRGYGGDGGHGQYEPHRQSHGVNRDGYREPHQGTGRQYGNGNQIPGQGDSDFGEDGEYMNGPIHRQSQGRGGRREGFENARGEFSNFETRRQADVNEDSELNDYTDARLGSSGTRGRKTGAAQTTRGSSGSARKTTGSTGRQTKSGRKGR